MNHFYRVLLVFTLAFTLCFPGHCAPNQLAKKSFDLEKANEKFASIFQDLAKPNIDLPTFTSKVQALDKISSEAEACALEAEKQLKILNELYDSIQLDATLPIAIEDDRYIQEEREYYSKQLAGCKLFVYRAQESLEEYKDTIQSMGAKLVFHRNAPFWRNFDNLQLAQLNQLDIQGLAFADYFNGMSTQTIWFGIFLVFLSGVLSYFFYLFCKQWVLRQKFPLSSIHIFIDVLSRHMIPLATLGTASLYLDAIFIKFSTKPLLVSVIGTLWLFTFNIAISTFLFSPPNENKNWLNLPKKLVKVFHCRLLIIMSLLVAGDLSATVFGDKGLTQALQHLILSTYVTILMSLILWALWPVFKLERFQEMKWLMLFKSALVTGFIAILACQWLGFQQLAGFILTGMMKTAVLCAAVSMLWFFISSLYKLVDSTYYESSRKFRDLLGVGPTNDFKEILLIKYIAYFIALCVLGAGLLDIWGASPTLIDDAVDSFLNGFTFAGIMIVPLRLIIAVTFFSCAFLMTRFIAARAARKQKFRGEGYTQVAISSIIHYIGFAISLVLALFLSGINFTSLAIIAGALSVGIGLGLQDIVNNFVSGVVLLLEQHIKPGDRIVVGNTEGFVKKIRIRSTQIRTLAMEDIIVPNAELISNQVTNYMFRDTNWRVNCPVGVAYGSNTLLVKKVLLEVASQNSDIAQEEPNEPSVLFRGFGESSLNFELWVIVHDVNKKFMVASDLFFAIDEAFKVNKISIAFPQRDIHIIPHEDENKA